MLMYSIAFLFISCYAIVMAFVIVSELSRRFDLSSQPPTLPHFHIPAITPPPAQPYGTQV